MGGIRSHALLTGKTAICPIRSYRGIDPIKIAERKKLVDRGPTAEDFGRAVHVRMCYVFPAILSLPSFVQCPPWPKSLYVHSQMPWLDAKPRRRGVNFSSREERSGG